MYALLKYKKIRLKFNSREVQESMALFLYF